MRERGGRGGGRKEREKDRSEEKKESETYIKYLVTRGIYIMSSALLIARRSNVHVCLRWGAFQYRYDLFRRVQRRSIRKWRGAALYIPTISCRLILGKTPNSMRCQQRIRQLTIPAFWSLCIGDDVWARNKIKVARRRLYSPQCTCDVCSDKMLTRINAV